MKRLRFVFGSDRFCATGMMSRQQRAEGRDRLVERGAAAGERVAEAVEVRRHRRARLVVEHVHELVELDGRGRRRGQRDRVAVAEAVVGAPARELDVLEAERGLERISSVESFGSGSGRLLELEPEHGDAGAVVVALGGDRVDRAHARAADADLVAAHERGGARHLGLERVGRHERQALVGVVGQEDRDEDHEDRGRADQDGVAGDAGAAVVHRRVLPEQVVQERLVAGAAVARAPASRSARGGAGPAARRSAPAWPSRSASRRPAGVPARAWAAAWASPAASAPRRSRRPSRAGSPRRWRQHRVARAVRAGRGRPWRSRARSSRCSPGSGLTA